MKTSVREVNTLTPYILESMEYYKGIMHPAGYEITVNKYCVEKAKTEEYDYDILLINSEIDFLFPIMEHRYFLGSYVIWELCKRQLPITLVSASDFLGFLTGYKEVVENKDNLKIIMPFFFYKEESYRKYEPAMLSFEQRLEVFTKLTDAGFNVSPFFNFLTQFKEEADMAMQAFIDADLYTFSAKENLSYTYIIDDKKVEMWKYAKDRSAPAMRDMF